MLHKTSLVKEKFLHMLSMYHSRMASTNFSDKHSNPMLHPYKRVAGNCINSLRKSYPQYCLHPRRDISISEQHRSSSHQRDQSASSSNSSYQQTTVQNTGHQVIAEGSVQSAGNEIHDTVLHKLSRMENRLRFYGYSVLRIGLGVMFATGLGIYIFREYIRENVADEVSGVASRSLSDEAVQMKAQEVSKDLIQGIFTDPTMQKQAVIFLGEIFQNPEVLKSLKHLVGSLLRDPSTQQEITAVLSWAITAAMSNPEFRSKLAANLHELLKQDAIREALKDLLSGVLHDEFVKEEARAFAKEVLASADVKDEATKLGQTAVQGIVADDTVQKKTGDALWSAFMYSLRPSWVPSWGSSTPDPQQPSSEMTQSEAQTNYPDTRGSEPEPSATRENTTEAATHQTRDSNQDAGEASTDTNSSTESTGIQLDANVDTSSKDR